MAARAYWQGQIRLALVSIPVEIYTATKSGAQIAFHQVHEPSGKRVKYEKVVPGLGAIDTDDIVKGYELRKGDYVLLGQDEIDVLYFERPYFVVPADDLAEEAFIVLREALRQSKKVGLGQLAMRGREYIVSLKPCGRGMVLETLRYADEVNKAQGYFRDIPDAKPDEDLLDLATTLIEKKSHKFDPSKFHDRYVDALKDLIARKSKQKTNRKIIEDKDEGGGRSASNVVDLMAALKKSIEKPGGAKPAAKRAPAKTAAKKAPVKKRA